VKDRVPQMSRALRTVRGALGSGIATVFAAASHAFAGGDVTPLAVIATSLLALPLCTALAGRVGSLWRLCIAIGASQFIYHWSFSGLGASTSGLSTTAASSPHAAHLGFVFSPLGSAATANATGDSTALMWLAHAAAAAVTVVLLYRGERAAQSLAAALLRCFLPRLPAENSGEHAPASTPGLLKAPPSPLLFRMLSPAAVTHRGPPVLTRRVSPAASACVF